MEVEAAEVEVQGLGEIIKEEGDPDSEAHVIDSKYCRWGRG